MTMVGAIDAMEWMPSNKEQLATSLLPAVGVCVDMMMVDPDESEQR